MAIALFMILGWATEIMDHGVTGLIGCYLFWALNVVSFDVATRGFGGALLAPANAYSLIFADDFAVSVQSGAASFA